MLGGDVACAAVEIEFRGSRLVAVAISQGSYAVGDVAFDAATLAVVGGEVDDGGGFVFLHIENAASHPPVALKGVGHVVEGLSDGCPFPRERHEFGVGVVVAWW